MTMPRLVLASRSPRRRELLERAGYRAEIVPAEVDEAPRRGESPRRYVRRLAKEKAWQVACRLRAEIPTLILGADTAVVLDGEILGKPADRSDGRRMLELLTGRHHAVLTGYAVLRAGWPSAAAGGNRRLRMQSGVVSTRVEFKALDDAEIDAYLDTGEPFDKAGGYAIQGAGAFMVRRIRGSHANVIGLPICEVVEALRDAGAMIAPGEREAASDKPSRGGPSGSGGQQPR
jgi:septum formation protein